MVRQQGCRLDPFRWIEQTEWPGPGGRWRRRRVIPCGGGGGRDGYFGAFQMVGDRRQTLHRATPKRLVRRSTKSSTAAAGGAAPARKERRRAQPVDGDRFENQHVKTKAGVEGFKMRL